MKKLYFLAILLLLMFVLSPTTNGLLTSSYEFRGAVSNDSEAYFIGKTVVHGQCAGYPVEPFLDSPLVEEMEGIPLIGANSITSLESVIVAEDIDISTASSLEDLIVQYYDHLTQYSNVDINTEEGFFLLGVQNGLFTVSGDFPYAASTFVTLEMIADTPTRFLATATQDSLEMGCSGDFAVLTTLSDTSTLEVKDRTGKVRWQGGSSNDYIVIQDSSFSITQHPPLSLVPLNDASEEINVSLSISAADPDDIIITQLVEEVSESLQENLRDVISSGFLEDLNQLDTFIRTASFAANGAIVYLQTNDTITIDESAQQFSSFGFVRFTTLDITNFSASSGPTLQGECTVAFLGDHFYTPQAQDSGDGTRFPYEMIIIWVVALGVFIYIRFFKRPAVNLEKDEKIKRYALVVHIIILVVALLLVDVEIHSTFGISALTALLSQGFSSTTGVFLGIEILIWIFGFCILAIPIQLLSYSILRVLGFGKGSNGVWKAAGDLSIWIFTGLYLLLFLNIIFSIIDVKSFFPLG